MKHFIKYIVQKTPCNIMPEVVNGLFGLGSSIAGFFGAKDQATKNYEYNLKLMQQQQNYNVENMNRQRDINKELARYGYDLETEFNSPSAQRQRMEAAGLNPYYNEQGAVSAASNPNMQQVSQPSVSIPNFQAQSPWSAFANLPSEFANIANATKAIAEAKKVGVETEQQQKAMDDFLKLLSEQVRSEKLKNDYQQVITNWYQQTGIHYLNEQDRELSVRIGLMCAQGNLADAEKLLNDEKYKQLKNENSLWSQIKDYIVRQKAAEAKDAEERVKTTQAQGRMFDAQGKAAIIGANNQTRLTTAQVDKLRKDGLHVDALRKLSDGQLKKLAQEVVGVYVTENGLEYVSQNEQQEMQRLLLEGMRTAVEQGKSDLFNPFRYVGGFFGGAGTSILGTMLK